MRIFRTLNVELPPFGQYSTGMLFMEMESYKLAKGAFINLAQSFDLHILCWRKLQGKFLHHIN